MQMMSEDKIFTLHKPYQKFVSSNLYQLKKHACEEYKNANYEFIDRLHNINETNKIED